VVGLTGVIEVVEVAPEAGHNPHLSRRTGVPNVLNVPDVLNTITG
jgi:hypothetical protein